MTTLPTPPDAVVFDCDGLLVDSEPWWERAEVDMFARRGLVLTTEQRAPLMGKSSWEVADYLTEVFHEPGCRDALVDELLGSVTELIRANVVAMPGAHHLVRAVARTGVPMAVASNSPRDIVSACLEGAGLDGLIHNIVSIEDVVYPKPAPDPYLVACERCGAAPSKSVGFEDSPIGLASAVAAGLFTVAVPSPSIGELDGDLVVPSLTDPVLTKWVASWR